MELTSIVMHLIRWGWVEPPGLACVGKGSGGKGSGGYQAVDHAEVELDAAVQHASRLLDRSVHMKTSWGDDISELGE